ncbi:unnamed protein product, partial [Mesorhabditis belari]|uniref:Protein kinase domain-containing protein n=1 Tax=Mesorhabditis belari TaxID=2138241 RepID=A0AAF3ECD3_9BILA
MGFAEFQHDQISKKFVLLLEKCDGGDLLTMINDRHKIYSMYTVVYWAEQLFSALEYLRTRNLIHRDIKAENVLLSIKPNQPNLSPNKIEYDVKLCDFAFTIHRENTTFFLMETWEESPKGTYASMSPEVYNCMDYQNGTARALGLELAVETDLNEERKIRPLGFDDTKQRKECASSCVMLNKALSSLSKIGETTDHEPSDRHRKLFLEKFDDVQQASLDAKAIYAGQSAIFSKRYKEIDPEFSKSEKIRSDRIDLSFKQILIADFKHQADVFKSTFDVLIETVNIPATELSDYVFQLQIPPRHSSTCKNPDDLILKAGFPASTFKVVPNRDRRSSQIGNFTFTVMSRR